jgi:hypothetical protein
MFFCNLLSIIAIFIAFLTVPIMRRVIGHLDKYFREPNEFDSPDWYWKVPDYFSSDGLITLEDMKILQGIFIKELNLDIASVKADFEIKKFGDVQKIADIFVKQSGYKGEIGNIDDFSKNAGWYVCQIIIVYLKCKNSRNNSSQDRRTVQCPIP